MLQNVLTEKVDIVIVKKNSITKNEVRHTSKAELKVGRSSLNREIVCILKKTKIHLKKKT